MKIVANVVVALFVWCGLGSTPVLGQTSEAVAQVGDVIRVSLPGEEILDRNFEVDRRGRLQLPEVGAVQVAGVPEREIGRAHV